MFTETSRLILPDQIITLFLQKFHRGGQWSYHYINISADRGPKYEKVHQKVMDVITSELMLFLDDEHHKQWTLSEPTTHQL